MPAPVLKLPYPRPTWLSDPHHDNTPDRLDKLIATDDFDLEWQEFQCLLGPFLPAGMYEEVAYFLPLAFDYLLAHDEHALDLVTSLVWFASEYAWELDRDNVLDAVRAHLRYCLDHWTNTFTIRNDFIEHSPKVMEATIDLIRFKAHGDLAIAFFADLAAADADPVKSAWFLESTRAHVSRDVYRPPKHPEVRRLLDDEHLAAKHATVVRAHLPDFDPATTYWRDTFQLLGLAGA